VRAWLGVGGVLLVVAGAAYPFLRTKSVAVSIATAERHPLRVPILCSGVLEPPKGGELRAVDGGSVASLAVPEGSRVAKGQPLLRLENRELMAERRAAEQEALRLRSEAASAEADLDRTKREEQSRHEVVEQDSRLLPKDALTKSAYEADVLALRQATAALASARERASSYSGDSGRVSIEGRHAADLVRRTDDLVIRAPAEGVVYGLPRRLGEAIAPGQVVASVTNPDRPTLNARVDEPDLPRVKAGQPIRVTFDGLPDNQWEGSVTSSAPGLHEIGGRQVGDVFGEIQDPRHLLPLNASVNVEITVGAEPSALVIPRTALNREGEHRFVYVIRDGRAERRDISTGLVGLNEVEVTQGLTDGERVVLPGSAPLSPGTPVTVASR
jgi:HlyD family secretion protein